MIKTSKLTKKFGSALALDGVDLQIEPGEFVFITGASGSGKTTLFRLIIRDLMADSGSLVVGGVDLAKLPGKKIPKFRQTIGTIFQDFKLLNDRSVFENISLPLMVRGQKDSEIEKEVKLALETVGLEDRSSFFPSQLSGGEIQRVAVARAIVGRPSLILADEPTGNLDPKTASSIANLLKQIHTHLKTTIVMVTHNAQIVDDLAQRVVTLSRGKVIKDAPKSKYHE